MLDRYLGAEFRDGLGKLKDKVESERRPVPPPPPPTATLGVPEQPGAVPGAALPPGAAPPRRPPPPPRRWACLSSLAPFPVRRCPMALPPQSPKLRRLTRDRPS